MASECGFSIYFKSNRIRFRNSFIHAIGDPEFIHLFIDSKDHIMYIQACEKDKDAFEVYFREEWSDSAFYLRGKILIEFIAKLIGAPDVASYRYDAVQVNEKTMMVALDEYEVITKGEE